MEEKRNLIPPVDIYENEEKFLLVLDMPATDKQNIEIECEADTLTVSAKVHEVEKEWKPVVSEFRLSDYKRTFNIGNRVNRDSINAKYENGILTIELAKSEVAKPRKIEVNVA